MHPYYRYLFSYSGIYLSFKLKMLSEDQDFRLNWQYLVQLQKQQLQDQGYKPNLKVNI